LAGVDVLGAAGAGDVAVAGGVASVSTSVDRCAAAGAVGI
jgi:hypothetical protein